MSATPTLLFNSVERQFTQRTGSIYDSMVKRFRERKSEKTGRITQIGREVPFTKEQFRDWLRKRLGGEGGVVQCEYCSTYVSAADLVIDHKVPPSRGGSLGFENLAIACSTSNNEKGRMTATGYIALRTWALVNLDPEDCKDLLSRLASQVQLATQKRWEMMKRFKQSKKQSEVQPDEVF